MDWLIIGGVVVAGWAMLSVLSGERINRSLHISSARAGAVAEKTDHAIDIPVAMSNEAALVGSPAAFNRKR